MSYNTKNYEKQGGAELVIGGDLNVVTGGKITSNGTQASAIANPTDLATCITQMTALLTAVRNVGLIP